MEIKPNQLKRFWRKVRKTSNCWEWIGAKASKSGYGHLTLNCKDYYSHRISWVIYFGKIPNKLCVLHKCDNPTCINPKHLWLGTQKDNAKDRDAKGRNGTKGKYGELCPRAKLTNIKVIEIRKKFIPYKYTIQKLSNEYGVSISTIKSVVYGYNWKFIM